MASGAFRAAAAAAAKDWSPLLPLPSIVEVGMAIGVVVAVAGQAPPTASPLAQAAKVGMGI
jgi:hypothetical protein